MALTADEQALLDSLTQKAKEGPVKKAFEDLGDVITYLVQTSDKFTTNPDDRQVALDVVKTAFPKVAETVAEAV